VVTRSYYYQTALEMGSSHLLLERTFSFHRMIEKKGRERGEREVDRHRKREREISSGERENRQTEREREDGGGGGETDA